MNNLTLEFLNKLKTTGLKYAIISGKYDEVGVEAEKVDSDFIEDLDIVFFDVTETILYDKLEKLGLKNNIFNSFRYNVQDDFLPIDIYIDYINCGYYYLFKIDKNNLQNINGFSFIKEEDYIFYQLIEPLVKFSTYKKRHKVRLNAYYTNNFINDKIRNKFKKLVGKKVFTEIFQFLFEDKDFSKNLLKLLKLRLLFKNNNLLRLINKRIIKNEKRLY